MQDRGSETNAFTTYAGIAKHKRRASMHVGDKGSLRSYPWHVHLKYLTSQACGKHSSAASAAPYGTVIQVGITSLFLSLLEEAFTNAPFGIMGWTGKICCKHLQFLLRFMGNVGGLGFVPILGLSEHDRARRSACRTSATSSRKVQSCRLPSPPPCLRGTVDRLFPLAWPRRRNSPRRLSFGFSFRPRFFRVSFSSKGRGFLSIFPFEPEDAPSKPCRTCARGDGRGRWPCRSSWRNGRRMAVAGVDVAAWHGREAAKKA